MSTFDMGAVALADAPSLAGSVPANSDLSGKAVGLASEIEAALARGEIEALTPEAVQELMSALCRTYTAQCELGGKDLPLAEGTMANATDVMMTASGLLRAANVASFEFAMWQSWGGH
jgi:hypothetical protein